MKTKFDTRVAPPSRVVSYLRFLLNLAVAVAMVVGGLALAQEIWHPFDRAIALMHAEFNAVDRTLSKESVAGVQFGALALALAVAGASLLTPGVRRKHYQISFARGLVSSLIFFVTDALYRYLKGRGDLYYVAAIALFVGATLVLVEILARWGTRAAEAERRTEFLASIVSGLSFALIVQAAEHLIESMKNYLR
jgi:hypothetical protein